MLLNSNIVIYIECKISATSPVPYNVALQLIYFICISLYLIIPTRLLPAPSLSILGSSSFSVSVKSAPFFVKFTSLLNFLGSTFTHYHIQYLSFSWTYFISIMAPKQTQAAESGKILFFTTEQSPWHTRTTSRSILLLIRQALSFHVLPTLNSAAVDIEVHASFKKKSEVQLIYNVVLVLSVQPRE